ncbi:hypothetical protein TNCV_3104781 [Trichonephila clavipes]|nr:hypothetical protein TNCV_3104781 [Trichonephila clavipes]
METYASGKHQICNISTNPLIRLGSDIKTIGYGLLKLRAIDVDDARTVHACRNKHRSEHATSPPQAS